MKHFQAYVNFDNVLIEKKKVHIDENKNLINFDKLNEFYF